MITRFNLGLLTEDDPGARGTSDDIVKSRMLEGGGIIVANRPWGRESVEGVR